MAANDSDSVAERLLRRPSTFKEALQNWESYPDNLPGVTESAKLIKDFKRHFEETKEMVLLVFEPGGGNTSRARARARANAIKRKIRLIIHDCGIQASIPTYGSNGNPSGHAGESGSDNGTLHSADGSNPSIAAMGDRMSYFILSPKDLEDLLRFPTGTTGDPVCRLIFLESTDRGSRQRFKITEDMLLRLLTYHYVSPCFLNFISYFGHNPMTGDSDLFFGGFRSLKTFAHPNFRVEELGRSGFHYQLSFELRTMFDEDDLDGGGLDTEPAHASKHRSRGRFNWLKRPEKRHDKREVNLDADNAGDGEQNSIRRVMQTVVYHSFDIDNGKSVWIVTSPEHPNGEKDSTKCSDYDVKGVLSTVDRVSSTSKTKERFQASLDVLVWLIEWSLSDYGFYIHALDDILEELTNSYASSMTANVVEETVLKELNLFMESLNECIVGLEANMRVCKALIGFYRSLLGDKKLERLKPAWIEPDREELEETIDDATAKIQNFCHANEDMLRRAKMVKEMGSRREDMIHRLLQNRNEQTMKELARLTHKDSATMRIFATITLILLPMSVVSTIFTTDIVRFPSSSSFVGNWSGAAAVWWTALTLLATALVGLISEAWRQAVLHRLALSSTAIPAGNPAAAAAAATLKGSGGGAHANIAGGGVDRNRVARMALGIMVKLKWFSYSDTAHGEGRGLAGKLKQLGTGKRHGTSRAIHPTTSTTVKELRTGTGVGVSAAANEPGSLANLPRLASRSMSQLLKLVGVNVVSQEDGDVGITSYQQGGAMEMGVRHQNGTGAAATVTA